MRREIIEGSNFIYSVGYSKEKQIVEIRLRDSKTKQPGKIYRYLDFPFEKYKAFRSADSMGKYFLTEIKPKHNCKKVEEDAHKAQPQEGITPTDYQEEGADDEETGAASSEASSGDGNPPSGK